MDLSLAVMCGFVIDIYCFVLKTGPQFAAIWDTKVDGLEGQWVSRVFRLQKTPTTTTLQLCYSMFIISRWDTRMASVTRPSNTLALTSSPRRSRYRPCPQAGGKGPPRQKHRSNNRCDGTPIRTPVRPTVREVRTTTPPLTVVNNMSGPCLLVIRILTPIALFNGTAELATDNPESAMKTRIGASDERIASREKIQDCSLYFSSLHDQKQVYIGRHKSKYKYGMKQMIRLSESFFRGSLQEMNLRACLENVEHWAVH